MLKKAKIILYPVLFCLLISPFQFKSDAQEVPNGDFEEWIIDGGPSLWLNNNLYWPPIECRQVWPNSQAYNGDICAMGIVDSCIELSVLRPPILTSEDINLETKPEALHGFYKYFPIGDDLLNFNVKLYLEGVLIGEGSFRSNKSITNFSEFVINFNYTENDTPDIAVVSFTIDSSLTDNSLHQGSEWIIDYLSFGPISGISDNQKDLPVNFNLYQNYPNPFNPITNINYSIPYQSKVVLKIYDVLGNEIETLVNEEKLIGSYEVEFAGRGLATGVYFYQLRAGSFVETKKMILIK